MIYFSHLYRGHIMKKIIVANWKGGCGKTTTASALASGLKSRGYRTLVIDLDPQGNLTTTTGVEEDSIEKTIKEFLQGEPLENVIIKSQMGDVVPCDLNLLDADRVFTQVGAIKMLKKALAKVEDNYDFCIMDAPPHPGILALNGLVACDYVLIPVHAAIFSIAGVIYLEKILDEVKEDENPDINVIGILRTRYNSRTKFGKQAASYLANLSQALDTTIFDTTIRQGVAVEQTQADGTDVITGAPDSKVAQDYEKFIDEFIERINKEEAKNE